MHTLKVTSGAEQGRTLEIEGEVIVGRESADLTLSDSELSRRHVAVREVEGGVEVEDLGSLNGTFVNGQRITAPVTLTASGSLRLGTTEMAVELALPEMRQVPDVTAPRAIPQDPNVTVQRPSPGPPPVDVTAVRPVASAQPPPAGPPPGVGPPGGGPPGGGPPGGGPPGGGPPGFGPPGRGGPPKIPAPMRVMLKVISKIPGGPKVMQLIFKLPGRLRIVGLLVFVLLLIGVPIAVIVYFLA